jgi:GxxExxY protein
MYKGVRLDCAYKIDLLVEDRLVVELKAVDRVPRIATVQLLTYLRILDRRLGLLINFHEPSLRNGVRRVVNGW